MDMVGSGGGGGSLVVAVAAAVTVVGVAVVFVVVVIVESLSIDNDDNAFVEQASDHTGMEMDGILVITIVLGGGGGFVRCLESTATDMAFVSYVTDVIHSNNHNVGTIWNWNNHNRTRIGCIVGDHFNTYSSIRACFSIHMCVLLKMFDTVLQITSTG